VRCPSIAPRRIGPGATTQAFPSRQYFPSPHAPQLGLPHPSSPQTRPRQSGLQIGATDVMPRTGFGGGLGSGSSQCVSRSRAPFPRAHGAPPQHVTAPVRWSAQYPSQPVARIWQLPPVRYERVEAPWRARACAFDRKAHRRVTWRDGRDRKSRSRARGDLPGSPSGWAACLHHTWRHACARYATRSGNGRPASERAGREGTRRG
jgi:hypothetical protein